MHVFQLSGGGIPVNDIHDFSKLLYCSSHGNLRRWHFCAQLVCLWIDIDHSKFEPHRVSHIISQCLTEQYFFIPLVQVHLPSVQEL